MYTDDGLREIFKEIPKEVDILLTHDAPFGTSDQCLEETFYNYKKANDEGALEFPHIGSIPLQEAIIEKKPKIVVHGHLHSSNHECEYLNDTKIYNVSLKDESYNVKFKPLVFEI